MNYSLNTVHHSNYYPYGMLMPGRHGEADNSDYRYGFNGKEKDDEVAGNGNSYDMGARMYNPRLGRMFSVDPWSKKYPWQTTYSYHRNSPIWKIDWNGFGDPPPGFWSSFWGSVGRGVVNTFNYINNNPAHAGYSVKPQVVTQEQIQIYSIDWMQILEPYNQIESFAQSIVGTVQGVYQFGEGIYEGDGAKTAQALPQVAAVVSYVFFKSSFLTKSRTLNGSWVSKSRGSKGMGYQSYLSGKRYQNGKILEYNYNGVDFDGYSNGILFDAKDGYGSWFNKNGTMKDWAANSKTAGKGLVKEANSQIKAAGGNKLQWIYSDGNALKNMRNYLKEEGVQVDKIEFKYVEKLTK